MEQLLAELDSPDTASTHAPKWYVPTPDRAVTVTTWVRVPDGARAPDGVAWNSVSVREIVVSTEW